MLLDPVRMSLHPLTLQPKPALGQWQLAGIIGIAVGVAAALIIYAYARILRKPAPVKFHQTVIVCGTVVGVIAGACVQAL